MKAFLISPTQNLIEVILSHLSGIEKDYSSNLVVFPGKRPSHFLRKALSERERSSTLPPRIFSMDEFVDYLYEGLLNRRKRKLEPVDAVAILYDIHRSSPNPLGKNSFISPDTFFPIGLKIFNDLEELYIEGVLPRTVKEIDPMSGGNIPGPTAKRLQSLSYFYETFYQKIDQAHYSTRSSRYHEASLNIERANLDPFEKIILAGFFGLTRAEKRIFDFFKRREETIFLFQDSFGIDLSELGIRAEMVGGKGNPAVYFYKSPDTHGQVLGMGSILKDQMERGEKLDENTVIVLPSAETLFPLFHQALNLLKPDGYNISLGYPLQRTPLFGLFNRLMGVITSMDGDRLYVPHYLQFILHPYIKNIYFDGRAEVTRILFHIIEEGLTEKRSKKFISLPEIEKDETILRYIRERILNTEPDVTLEGIRDHLKAIHRNTIERMTSCRNVGDFAVRLKEVIEYIYEKSTAHLHPFFYPYAESFATQLDLLSRSLMREVRFGGIGSYFNLIKKVIAATYTPFTGTPIKGIQVLGFLETRNIQFEKVFFLDANEGIVPEITKEDSLLPFQVRKRLGLPTYLDRERLAACYFDTLLRGAREVHLFYVENAEKDRSRFVERLLWERQKEERKSDDKGYVKAIQYSVTLRGKRPHPVKKSDEVVRFLKDYFFSPSSLDTYLRCPLMFYYEHVLGLTEREVVSDELEREEIGLFIHRVLLDYFKGKMGRILSEKDMNLRELEGIIHDCFKEKYGEDPSGEIYLLRTQMEKHLKDFIRNWQIPKIKEMPIEIIALEHRLEVLRESFKLTARLDRVEKRAGRTAIIDYKTTANRSYLSIHFNKLNPQDRESWSEAIGTLQLPFYLIVYSQETGKRPEEIDCSFLLLGRNIIQPSIELPLFEDPSEFGQGLSDLHHILFTLLREVIDPEYPFMPTTSPKHKCHQCLYRSIC